MRITANKVTLARIAFVPIPCAFLIYGGETASWLSFVIFLILGASDFIDGMMARREGPTVLGGLLDPVADKIFVSSIILTLSGAGIFGFWFPALVLLREFLLTALRTSMSLKRHSIVTSKLGKLKTIYQMGGLGTIFLTLALPKLWLTVTMIALTAGLFLIWLQLRRKGDTPSWIFPVLGAFVGVGILGATTTVALSVLCQAVVISILTWLSGFTYIAECYKIFTLNGLTAGDKVRLYWVVAISCGICPLVSVSPELVLPIVITIGLELALGGVDNIIAAETGFISSKALFITGSAAILTTACFYLDQFAYFDLPMVAIGIAMTCVSGLTLLWSLIRWRSIFWRAL